MSCYHQHKALDTVNRILMKMKRNGRHLASVAETEMDRKAHIILNDLNSRWNRYFGVYGLNFECNTEETNYITRPRDAIFIHNSIAAILGEMECTCFIDAFACIGGDTLAAMDQFKRAKIHAVQEHTDDGRFERLSNNIRNFMSTISSRLISHDVEVHEKNIKDFLSDLAQGTVVSVLYLDPPWQIGPEISSVEPVDHSHWDPKNDYSPPVVLHEFLQENILGPLINQNNYPELIVLKLPGIPHNPDIEIWLKNLNGFEYRQMALLTPREKYAVYIFKKFNPGE